jgi:RNA polymerase sigma-70 factor (ECF subfamily)
VTAEELRPLMLSIAYRLVGSFSEAEDLVQEAFIRLHETDDVESPKA